MTQNQWEQWEQWEHEMQLFDSIYTYTRKFVPTRVPTRDSQWEHYSFVPTVKRQWEREWEHVNP